MKCFPEKWFPENVFWKMISWKKRKRSCSWRMTVDTNIMEKTISTVSILFIVLVSSILLFFILHHLYPFFKKIRKKNYNNNNRKLLAGATSTTGNSSSARSLTKEEEEKEKELETYSPSQFRKVASALECTDPLYPYFDAATSTCVQCFEDSFNCLTGFQRCLRGKCVKKNSPQCSYYPIGLVGGTIWRTCGSSNLPFVINWMIIYLFYFIFFFLKKREDSLRW